MESKGPRVCFVAQLVTEGLRGEQEQLTMFHEFITFRRSSERNPAIEKKKLLNTRKDLFELLLLQLDLRYMFCVFLAPKKGIETFEMRKISCGNSQMPD